MSSTPARPVPKAISRLALAALLLTPTPALASPPPASPAAPAPDPAIQARASKAVADARAAFERADYAAAITHFESALALRPAPKIHFNLGVCHTRLLRAAEARNDAEARSTHTAAAIAAFNTYLRALPGADDRDEVADMVRTLGGTPATTPQPTDPPQPPPPEAPEPTPTPTPKPASTGPLDRPLKAIPMPMPAAIPAPMAVPDAPPPLPRGYIGLELGLAAQPQLLTRRDLDGGVQGLFVVRGGARLGKRRRMELGGQLTLAVPPDVARATLALSTQTVVLDLGHAFPLGSRRRLELSVGGLLGAAREALRVRDGQPLPTCAIQSTGDLVAARAGGVLGGRVGFAVLVGPRRNHELGMHLTSAFHGFGPGPNGSAGSTCDGPLLRDVPRARFVLTSAIGYAFRF